MMALFSELQNLGQVLTSPVTWVLVGFQVWMLIDAIRREEFIWAIFIFFFSIFSALLYYFLVYRQAGPVVTQGFELPGAHDRRRIKELEAKIHHLDNAHHHAALGDIYFQQGKLEPALESYQRAFERDSEDLDIRGHLGQCLLRMQRPAEAKALLESVCQANPKHDYGHSMMALAEAHTALGETEAALQAWRRVLEENSYARARVQLAELLIAAGQADEAAAELKEVIADDASSPDFQRKRDRIWIRRSKQLLRQLGQRP